MSKAYNANGVETPQFRKDNLNHHVAVVKAVNDLMSLGYSGQDVSYLLGGSIQLAVASNNITNAFKRIKEEK
jgi:hypothetical protein